MTLSYPPIEILYLEDGSVSFTVSQMWKPTPLCKRAVEVEDECFASESISPGPFGCYTTVCDKHSRFPRCGCRHLCARWHWRSRTSVSRATPFRLPPIIRPSGLPSFVPSASPSSDPRSEPSAFPSSIPSSIPSASPSASPSGLPSTTPSVTPSVSPSTEPSLTPIGLPSRAPSALHLALCQAAV